MFWAGFFCFAPEHASNPLKEALITKLWHFWARAAVVLLCSGGKHSLSPVGYSKVHHTPR